MTIQRFNCVHPAKWPGYLPGCMHIVYSGIFTVVCEKFTKRPLTHNTIKCLGDESEDQMKRKTNITN